MLEAFAPLVRGYRKLLLRSAATRSQAAREIRQSPGQASVHRHGLETICLFQRRNLLLVPQSIRQENAAVFLRVSLLPEQKTAPLRSRLYVSNAERLSTTECAPGGYLR